MTEKEILHDLSHFISTRDTQGLSSADIEEHNKAAAYIQNIDNASSDSYEFTVEDIKRINDSLLKIHSNKLYSEEEKKQVFGREGLYDLLYKIITEKVVQRESQSDVSEKRRDTNIRIDSPIKKLSNALVSEYRRLYTENKNNLDNRLNGYLLDFDSEMVRDGVLDYLSRITPKSDIAENSLYSVKEFFSESVPKDGYYFSVQSAYYLNKTLDFLIKLSGLINPGQPVALELNSKKEYAIKSAIENLYYSAVRCVKEVSDLLENSRDLTPDVRGELNQLLNSISDAAEGLRNNYYDAREPNHQKFLVKSNTGLNDVAAKLMTRLNSAGLSYRVSGNEHEFVDEKGQKLNVVHTIKIQDRKGSTASFIGMVGVTAEGDLALRDDYYSASVFNQVPKLVEAKVNYETVSERLHFIDEDLLSEKTGSLSLGRKVDRREEIRQVLEYYPRTVLEKILVEVADTTPKGTLIYCPSQAALGISSPVQKSKSLRQQTDGSPHKLTKRLGHIDGREAVEPKMDSSRPSLVPRK